MLCLNVNSKPVAQAKPTGASATGFVYRMASGFPSSTENSTALALDAGTYAHKSHLWRGYAPRYTLICKRSFAKPGAIHDCILCPVSPTAFIPDITCNKAKMLCLCFFSNGKPAYQHTTNQSSGRSAKPDRCKKDSQLLDCPFYMVAAGRFELSTLRV